MFTQKKILIHSNEVCTWRIVQPEFKWMFTKFKGRAQHVSSSPVQLWFAGRGEERGLGLSVGSCLIRGEGGSAWRTSSQHRKAGAILACTAMQKDIFTRTLGKIVIFGFCLPVAPWVEQLEGQLGTELCKAAVVGAAGLHIHIYLKKLKMVGQFCLCWELPATFPCSLGTAISSAHFGSGAQPPVDSRLWQSLASNAAGMAQ